MVAVNAVFLGSTLSISMCANGERGVILFGRQHCEKSTAKPKNKNFIVKIFDEKICVVLPL